MVLYGCARLFIWHSINTGIGLEEDESMDLQWNDERLRKFVTNIGLITSNGPHGHNMMTAEWTHHVSYAPSLIMLNIHDYDATYENIKESKEFGVNIAGFDQNMLVNISGTNSGKKVDKIKVLEELGIRFYKAKKIDTLMIDGASMNAECKLIKSEKIGDHIMLIGEVIEVSATDKQPLIYHNGKYWKLGEPMPKPKQEMLDNISKIIAKYTKK